MNSPKRTPLLLVKQEVGPSADNGKNKELEEQVGLGTCAFFLSPQWIADQLFCPPGMLLCKIFHMISYFMIFRSYLNVTSSEKRPLTLESKITSLSVTIISPYFNSLISIYHSRYLACLFFYLFACLLLHLLLEILAYTRLCTDRKILMSKQEKPFFFQEKIQMCHDRIQQNTI